MNRKKFLKSVCIIFLISLALEVFVFNFRFYETMGNEEMVVDINDVKFNDGLLFEPDNKWILDGDELKPSFVVTDDKEKSFEILNINKEIDNIYIDIANVKTKSYQNKKTVVKLSATDEANALYYDLPERDIVSDVEKSKYISLNLSGESEKLKVKINAGENNRFVIESMKINAKYPMFFSFARLAVVFLIMLAVYIVRPNSPFYSHILNLKSKKQKLVLGIIIATHIFGFIGVSLCNPNFVFTKYEHHLQYQRLTDAILDGHVYLDQEPSEALKSMENPYDNELRKQVLKEAGEKFLWDRAYYNGKYYVYFGIVPVLTFYLPFKALTGFDFPTFAGIVITACIMIFSVLGLVSQIIKRWFKNVPFITYVLLSFFFIDSCGIMYILKSPNFYSLPIIMAIMFSISGLYFWLSSFKYTKTENDNDEVVGMISKTKFKGFINWRLCAGSLCMALVAGCRPQILMGSFLAIPLFYNIVFKERMLFSKKSIKSTLAFVLPYVIIAAGVMYYNYIRFDSVFDFGANYNLTTNDMTSRGIVLGRTTLGIFTYLFQPPAYSPRFPFISDVWFYTNYMGRTIHEYLFGGILFNHFILCINLFVFKFKKTLKLKGLFAFCLVSICSSIIIVIADTQLAGLLQRYMTDFAWLMFIPAIILVLSLFERVNDYLRKHLYTVLLCGLAFSFYYDFATIFFYGDNALYNANPTVHYTVAHLVQFWL